MSWRKTEEELKKWISDLGFTLKSSFSEYKNNKSKLLFGFAKCEHSFCCKLLDLKVRSGCIACGTNRKKRVFSPDTILKIQEKLRERNGKWLDNKYVNAHSPLSLECHSGHKFKCSWGNLKNGHWCHKCIKPGVAGFEHYNEIIGKNFKCVDPESFKTSTTILTWICSKGHKISSSCANLSRSFYCDECRKDKTFEEIMQIVQKRGGRAKDCREKFKDVRQKIEIECGKGHSWKVSGNCIKRGNWCPICSKNGRKSQKILFSIIKKRFPDAEYEKRGILSNKMFELDIFIPSLMIAIELDGEYWHSLSQVTEREGRKNSDCTDNGILLIRIPWKEFFIDSRSFLRKGAEASILALIDELRDFGNFLPTKPFEYYKEIMS